MRFAISIAAAMAAAYVAVPAKAATIVQTDGNLFQSGFQAFDTYLGTLNAVTLAISVQSPRDLRISLPDDGRASISLPYTINGSYGFRVFNPTVGNIFTGEVSLAGAGTATAALTASGGRLFGSFSTRAEGLESFDLEPGLFLSPEPFDNLGNLRIVDGSDRGYLSPSVDTTFSGLPDGADVIGDPFAIAEDFRVSAIYRLTYDYTPTSVAAVPEPTTWGMMLIGFGAIGGAMRHRARRRLQVAFTHY